VTQIASSSVTAASAQIGATTNDVTNYKVYIRLIPESYSDLIDPKRPKSFPFRPGMTASADIQTKTKANVVAVSINAVTTREKGTDNVVAGNDKKADNNNNNDNSGDDQNTKTGLSSDLDEVVFVLQPDGKVKKVKVKTDIQDINNIEVLSGLKEGDEVVVAPYNVISKTLHDGMKVQVVAKDKLFEAKK
jgi:HlyD family secretion protein